MATQHRLTLWRFRYERLAWFPVLITFLVALGVGGKQLSNPPPSEPTSGPAILSFASTLAGFAITYSGLSSDFTSYFEIGVSSWGVFWASYLGLLLPIVCLVNRPLSIRLTKKYWDYDPVPWRSSSHRSSCCSWLATRIFGGWYWGPHGSHASPNG